MSQNAQSTKSDRRSSTRLCEPLFEIRCDGELYMVNNWSFSGCKIENYSGKLRPGHFVSFEMYLLGFHDFEGLSIQSEVMRFEPENGHALAIKFSDLSVEAVLDYCDRMERSAPNDDLLQRIEKSVDKLLASIVETDGKQNR